MNAKDSLIATTQQLLWERGYESTSPREIQDQAGVGQGSFYHHFEGKLDLASQALEKTSRQMTESAMDLLENRAIDPMERLRRYLGLRREALRGCKLGRHALESSIELPEIRIPVQSYFERLAGAVASVLAELGEAGRLPAQIDAARLADSLVASIQGGYVLARVFQDPARLESALAGTLVLLENLVSQAQPLRPDSRKPKTRAA